MKRFKIAFLLAGCLLFMGGCNTTEKENGTNTSDTAIDTKTDETSGELTELKAENWYATNYQGLVKLIEDYGQKSSAYNEKEKPYAVFDWDKTTIFNDVGETVFLYQIENLLFNMDPAEMDNAIRKDIPKDNFGEDWNNKNGEAVNIDKIASDLLKDYTFIYDNYKGFKGEKSLEEIKETNEYKDFSTKLRYVYSAIGDTFSPDISYPWVTYMFTGMTNEEAQNVSKEGINYGLKQPISEMTWESPSDMQTNAGQVSIDIETGIRTQPEMQNLYQTLQANGIDVYVCSASYIDVIIPFATSEEYGYQIPKENVFAMRLEMKDGKIQTQFNHNYPQTQGKGKSETIVKFIAPQHDGNDPLLVAGDSGGDYAMLSEFSGLKYGLLFNRGKQGDIGELCQIAVDTSNQANQKYYLQGRDENTGKFLQSEEVILFGKEKPELYYNK